MNIQYSLFNIQQLLTKSVVSSILSTLLFISQYPTCILFGNPFPRCGYEAKEYDMQIPSILEMLQAGVHFGHQVSRWHPKMKPYIFTDRSGVHILDLEKTREELEKTLAEVKRMVSEGKNIVFVTTKPQAKEIVKQAAIDCGMPYLVDRWIGGFLTNFREIKKLIHSYVTLKEQDASGEFERYTKKEQLRLREKIAKLDKSLAGLSTITSMPDSLFLPAMQREKTAVMEANATGVDIIAVCDTNANPQKATLVIPANDDAVRSIEMIVGLVRDAVNEGRAQMKTDAAKKTQEEEEEIVVAIPVIETPEETEE